MASKVAPTLPPNATLHLSPFTIAIPDSYLSNLQHLLKTTKLPPPTYESTQSENFWGADRDFMLNALEHWQTGYDWRKSEEYINSFPQFTTTVKISASAKDGREREEEYKMHFVGIFSEDKDAVPVLLMHGWPGSYLELLPLLHELQSLPGSPPVHLIVPSHPGFGFSGSPPLDRDFSTLDIASIMDSLMTGLGFGLPNGGYVVHGGDVGAIVARVLAVKYPSCKGMHVNAMLNASTPDTTDGLDDFDSFGFNLLKAWRSTGFAYVMAQNFRPATMQFVMASNPVALMSWIAQFQVGPIKGGNLPLDKFLENLSLWWFTETYATSIYFYRHLQNPIHTEHVPAKPVGYSAFKKELVFTAKAWLDKAVGNLVFYRRHEEGGHFAALEQPKVMAEDVVAYLDAYLKSPATVGKDQVKAEL